MANRRQARIIPTEYWLELQPLLLFPAQDDNVTNQQWGKPMAFVYKCPHCKITSTFSNVAHTKDVEGIHHLMYCHNCRKVVYGKSSGEDIIKIVYPN